MLYAEAAVKSSARDENDLISRKGLRRIVEKGRPFKIPALVFG